MVELTGESVIQAVVDKIRELIPEVDIRRWQNGRQVFVTRPLSVHTDTDTFDANNENEFPYIFINEYDLSRRFFNAGNADKFYFTYFFELQYFVDIRPTDITRIPRINEELRAMKRKLMIAFDRLEVLGDTYHVDISPPPAMSEGVLHFFIQIRDIPEYVFSDPVPKVEKYDLDLELIDRVEEVRPWRQV